MTAHHDVWDAVVCGAGMSGSACGLALAERGLRVLVLCSSLDTVGQPAFGPLVALGDSGLESLADLPPLLRRAVLETSFVSPPSFEMPFLVMDRRAVSIRLKLLLEETDGIELRQAVATGVEWTGGEGDSTRLVVHTAYGDRFITRASILAVGMGFGGRVAIGSQLLEGGRHGELPADELWASLRVMELSGYAADGDAGTHEWVSHRLHVGPSVWGLGREGVAEAAVRGRLREALADCWGVEPRSVEWLRLLPALDSGDRRHTVDNTSASPTGRYLHSTYAELQSGAAMSAAAIDSAASAGEDTPYLEGPFEQTCETGVWAAVAVRPSPLEETTRCQKVEHPSERARSTAWGSAAGRPAPRLHDDSAHYNAPHYEAVHHEVPHDGMACHEEAHPRGSRHEACHDEVPRQGAANGGRWPGDVLGNRHAEESGTAADPPCAWEAICEGGPEERGAEERSLAAGIPGKGTPMLCVPDGSASGEWYLSPGSRVERLEPFGLTVSRPAHSIEGLVLKPGKAGPTPTGTTSTSPTPTGTTSTGAAPSGIAGPCSVSERGGGGLMWIGLSLDEGGEEKDHELDSPEAIEGLWVVGRAAGMATSLGSLRSGAGVRSPRVNVAFARRIR